MQIKIYKSNQHKEIAIVFYIGNYGVLYSNHIDTINLMEIVELAEKGLSNPDLLALDAVNFNKRYTYTNTIKLEIDND